MVEIPEKVTAEIFEVLVPMPGLLIGDRIIVRPGVGGPSYDLYRRLRSADVEELLTPDHVALRATEPDGGYAEAARLFARSPSSRRVLLRQVK